MNRLGAVLFTLLIGLSGCKNTYYPADKMVEVLQKTCQKEYQLAVEARLVGKTFTVFCVVDGLLDNNFNLKEEFLNKLEGAMLSSTRVILSANVPVDFQVIQARDPHLGVTVTLLRYFPDIKGLIYMKHSQSDVQNRLVFEINEEKSPPNMETLREITLGEFIARLIAFRLEQQFSANPLMNALLQIHRIRGTVRDGKLILTINRNADVPWTSSSPGRTLFEQSVEKMAMDVLAKYNLRGPGPWVFVEDGRGSFVMELEFRRIKPPHG
jgi:hypothetical protein